jgi:hypothetical protein
LTPTKLPAPPKPAEEEIENRSLVPIPNQDQYPEQKNNMIPKYKNIFETEKYIAVS